MRMSRSPQHAARCTYSDHHHSCARAMPQSLTKIILHIVFATKNRKPFIYREVRPALFAYLAVVTRNLGCECYRAGGVADHVHLAVRLSQTVSVAALVQELKASSSKWLKTQSPTLSNFAWQRGYSAFSVRDSGLEIVIRYIENQETHHRKRSFKDEHRETLQRERMAFDERYVWD